MGPVTAYAVAIVAVVMAVLLRWLLDPVMGDALPLVTLFGAVAAAAWAGGYGPAFLVLENYRVIRRYNTSDLYAVFVGHLADRIAGGGDFETPCCTAGPQRTKTIEGIQKRLGDIGYDIEKIDGKVGSNTRRQIGAYQKASNLKIDCWPSDTLLAHMMRNSTTR